MGTVIIKINKTEKNMEGVADKRRKCNTMKVLEF